MHYKKVKSFKEAEKYSNVIGYGLIIKKKNNTRKHRKRHHRRRGHRRRS